MPNNEEKNEKTVLSPEERAKQVLAAKLAESEASLQRGYRNAAREGKQFQALDALGHAYFAKKMGDWMTQSAAKGETNPELLEMAADPASFEYAFGRWKSSPDGANFGLAVQKANFRRGYVNAIQGNQKLADALNARAGLDADAFDDELNAETQEEREQFLTELLDTVVPDEVKKTKDDFTFFREFRKPEITKGGLASADYEASAVPTPPPLPVTEPVVPPAPPLPVTEPVVPPAPPLPDPKPVVPPAPPLPVTEPVVPTPPPLPKPVQPKQPAPEQPAPAETGPSAQEQQQAAKDWLAEELANPPRKVFWLFRPFVALIQKITGTYVPYERKLEAYNTRLSELRAIAYPGNSEARPEEVKKEASAEQAVTVREEKAPTAAPVEPERERPEVGYDETERVIWTKENVREFMSMIKDRDRVIGARKDEVINELCKVAADPKAKTKYEPDTLIKEALFWHATELAYQNTSIPEEKREAMLESRMVHTEKLLPLVELPRKTDFAKAKGFIREWNKNTTEATAGTDRRDFFTGMMKVYGLKKTNLVSSVEKSIQNAAETLAKQGDTDPAPQLSASLGTKGAKPEEPGRKV